MTENQILTATPMRSMWVLITPDIAARWLEANTDNRNVRQNRVAQYARDMNAGLWTPSNDAIVIADNGRLGRSFADALHSTHEDNYVQLAATLSKAAALARGVGKKGVWTFQGSGVSDADRRAYLAEHPQIRDSVNKWATQRNAKGAGCKAPVLALGHHLIERAAGTERADEFMHQLVTQDCEPAAGTIRTAVAAIQAARYDAERQLALIAWAWNHWATGREVTLARLGKEFRATLPRFTSTVTR